MPVFWISVLPPLFHPLFRSYAMKTQILGQIIILTKKSKYFPIVAYLTLSTQTIKIKFAIVNGNKKKVLILS
jgi:hypothetical protein